VRRRQGDLRSVSNAPSDEQNHHRAERGHAAEELTKERDPRSGPSRTGRRLGEEYETDAELEHDDEK